MLILDTTCSDYGIIQFVKILKTIFQMIQILGPVLAMASLGFIFLKNVSGDSETMVKNKKRIRNCLVALVVTFFLPIFVNLVMGATFMKDTFEISACWKAADSYKYGKSQYISKNGNKKSTGTFIIDPSQYKGTNGNPNEEGGSGGTGTPSTSLSKAFVDLAVAQLNDPSAKGGRKYWEFAGYKTHMLWCAEFVTWNVFHTEYNGEKLTKYLNKKCVSSQCWANYCKSNANTKFYNAKGHVPKEGDLIFFNYNGKGISHIGIVRYSDNNKVYTIEGNVSDRVRKRTISLSDKHLVGYCSWY